MFNEKAKHPINTELVNHLKIIVQSSGCESELDVKEAWIKISDFENVASNDMDMMYIDYSQCLRDILRDDIKNVSEMADILTWFSSRNLAITGCYPISDDIAKFLKNSIAQFRVS